MESPTFYEQYQTIVNIVIGGLIVGAFWRFWDGIIFIAGKILPSAIYDKEIDISGKWETTFTEDEKESHEIVTIKQSGRRVKGNIDLIEADKIISSYNFKGIFKHRVLAGIYESDDPKDYEQGSFTLNYIKERQGPIFKGQYAFLSNERGDIISSPYKWKPKV